MPLQIPVGYANAAIAIKGSLDPEPWIVTHGITTDLANFSGEEHADAVFAAFTTAWGGLIQNTSQVLGVTLTIGSDSTDPVIVSSTGLPVTGGTSGAMLPQNCALLIKKQSGLGGRRNRGRCYMPSVLREAQVDQYGGIEGPELASMQSAASLWLTTLEEGVGVGDPELTMVILHNYNSGTLDPLPPTPVTSLAVDPKIATQRRRLRR